MNDVMKFIIQDPKNDAVHLAMQHPVYQDHYVTKCGLVVTTSDTRHETDLTGFRLVERTQEVTYDGCQES